MSDGPAWGEPQRPEGGEPPPDDAWPQTSEVPPADVQAGGTAAGADQGSRLPPPPADPNATAIERAGLNQESTAWLQEVARQVEPRLDRVAPNWRRAPQAETARACAFGLLLGFLARTYPHARNELGRAAEAHPSYSTLPPGNRLATLEQISANPQQMSEWLGPLLEVTDPQQLRGLLD